MPQDSDPEESTKSQHGETLLLRAPPPPTSSGPRREGADTRSPGKAAAAEAHTGKAPETTSAEPTAPALTCQVLRLETPPGLAYQRGLVLSLLRRNDKREGGVKGRERPGLGSAPAPRLYRTVQRAQLPPTTQPRNRSVAGEGRPGAQGLTSAMDPAEPPRRRASGRASGAARNGAGGVA